MHVSRMSFNGNPNIGLYGFCTGDYVLIGPEVPRSLHAQLSEIFQAEVKVITIAGTSFLGVFLAGNRHCVLIPDIIYDEELEKIKKLHIPYKVMATKLTCFGNNILVNDKFALISTEYSEREAKRLSEALKVPFSQKMIASANTVGSVAIMNSKGCLLHHEAPETDIHFIKKHFDVDCDHGSVNLGNPYVKSGILLNDKGFIIGELSGGPEIVHADRIFGFID